MNFFSLLHEIHFQLQVQFTTFAAHLMLFMFIYLKLHSAYMFFDVHFVAVIMRNPKAKKSYRRSYRDGIEKGSLSCITYFIKASFSA